MFKFHKYVDSQKDSLYIEKRLTAKASGFFYQGMALTLNGGELVYAQTANTVYAISNVSVVSGDVSASYKPEVYPVNANQVWKGSVNVTNGTAVTAAFLLGGKTQIDAASCFGTAVNGAIGGTNGSTIYVYDFDSAVSAVGYFIFPDPVNMQET